MIAGGEFKCEDLEGLLRKYGINHYFSYQDRKCAIIERYNRTLQDLLYKLMKYFHTFNWVKLLKIVEKIYLNRVHTTTGMSPLKAELDSSQEKLTQVYNRRYSKIKRRKPRFKVGDQVRIARQKTKFTRAYNEHFTQESFIISKVLVNQPIPRYQLKDRLGNLIIGTFFENEITKYQPKQEKLYNIEQILQKRKNPVTKKMQYLVKWENYDKIHNSWVDADQIANI